MRSNSHTSTISFANKYTHIYVLHIYGIYGSFDVSLKLIVSNLILI